MGQRRGNGEGSVYRRGGRWAYQLPLHLTGPGERSYRGGFTSKREAQDALRDAITTSARGEYVRPARLTVREYADDVFLPKEKAQRRASTYAMYESRLAIHVLPHIGDLRLQRVTPMHLQRLWSL